MNRKVRTTRRVLIIWFLGSFFLLYQFLLQTAPSVMIEPLKNSLHTSALGVGFLSSSYFYTYILLQVPAGILVDRCNIRYVYVACISLLALTCLCFALSQSFAQSIVLRILMGIFAAPGLVSAFYLINQWFFKKYFSVLVGLTELYCMLGAAMGQIILAQGVIHIGWRSTMLVFGIAGIAAAIFAAIYIRERKAAGEKIITQHITKLLWRCINASEVEKPKEPSQFIRQLKRLFSMPEVWVAGLVSGIAFAVLSAFAGFWCIPFLQNNFGLTLGHAAMASSTIFVGCGLCTPLFGLIVEKLKHCELWMALGLFIAALLFLPFVILKSIPIYIIIPLLIALGMLAALYVTPFALVKKMVSNEISATAMGLVNMLSVVVGAPCLLPLTGCIIHFAKNKGISSTGSYEIGLVCFPVLLVIASIACLWLTRQKSKQNLVTDSRQK